MAQDISYILTKEKLDISSETIHFQNENLTIILLDVYEHNILEFIEISKIHINIEKIIGYIFANEIEDDELMNIANTIKDLNLKTFVLEHTSDWADIPIETYSLAIINKEVILQNIDDWKGNKISIGLNEKEYSEFDVFKFRNYNECKNNFKNNKLWPM